MSATQTLSASLVLLVVTSSVLAFAEQAEPDVEPDVRAGEAPPTTPTGYFSFGAGYRPDDDVIVESAVGQDNLFGTGRRLRLATTLSSRHLGFRVDAEDPTLLGGDLRLRASVYDESDQLPGSTRVAAGGSFGASLRLERHLRAFATYRYEDVSLRLDGVALARGGPLLAGPLDGRIGALRVGLEYDRRSEAVMPRRGTRYGVAIDVADPRLGSDHAFRRFDVWADHHRPLGPLTLHLAGAASTLRGTAPLSERLHFDGSSQVRGLAPGALGPSLGGMSLGGDSMAAGRAELEVPLIRKLGISAVGFVDAAAIVAHGAVDIGVSYGVGLLWRSPIGPLRFDLVLGPDREPTFQFSLGGAW